MKTTITSLRGNTRTSSLFFIYFRYVILFACMSIFTVPINSQDVLPASAQITNPDMPFMTSIGDEDFEFCDGYGTYLFVAVKNQACTEEEVTHLWSTNETGQSIQIFEEGTYSVTSTDCDGTVTEAQEIYVSAISCPLPEATCDFDFSGVNRGDVFDWSGVAGTFTTNDNSTLRPGDIYTYDPVFQDENQYTLDFEDPICNPGFRLLVTRPHGDYHWVIGEPIITVNIYDHNGNLYILSEDEVDFDESIITYEGNNEFRIANRSVTTLIFTPNTSMSKLEHSWGLENVENANLGYINTYLTPFDGCECELRSLGSTVFIDGNDDGLQLNVNENGIRDVQVSLFGSDGSMVSSMVTDENGNYFFDNLLSDQYMVRVTPSDAYPTSSTGSSSDQTKDGDDNGLQLISGGVVSSGLIDLTGVQPLNESFQGGDQDSLNDLLGNMTIDFGFKPNMSIGSLLFVDEDSDGVYDEGEALIGGATVRLYRDSDGSGEIEADEIGDEFSREMETEDDGLYFFGDLLEGDYQVVVEPVDKYPLATQVFSDADDDIDGDSNGVQEESGEVAVSPIIRLRVGDEPTGDGSIGDEEDSDGGSLDDVNDANGNMTVDFGFVGGLSVGSTVFYDEDKDGEYDESLFSEDLPLEDVEVVLYADLDGDDVYTDVVARDTTDSDGNYFFGDLSEGSYQIGVVPSDVFPLATQDDQTEGLDNNSNGTQEVVGQETRSEVFELKLGEEPTGSAESGSGDVDNADDGQIDENGDMTIDFGFVGGLSIGSTVFEDNDGDGEQNRDASLGALDEGIDGATVRLYKDDGDGVFDGGDDFLEEMITSNGGSYLFDTLLPGNYFVVVTPPADNPRSSIPTDGNDNGEDGDDNGVQVLSGEDAISPLITLDYGTEPMNEPYPGGDQDDTNGLDSYGDMTVDFGFVPLMSLGSTVFIDSDRDGMQDDDEELLPNYEFTLRSIDRPSEIITVVTDNEGNYFVDGLYPGRYELSGDFPDGYKLTTEESLVNNEEDGDNNGTSVDGGSGWTTSVIVLEGGMEPTDEPFSGGIQDDGNDDNGDMTVDIGFVELVSVGSTVFYDSDKDGVYDQGADSKDSPISGVDVVLYADLDGDDLYTDIVATDTTNSEGNYYFGDLDQGSYQISVSPSALYPKATITDQGTGEDHNSNGVQAAIGEESSSEIFTLLAGEEPTGSEESGSGDVDNGSVRSDANGDMTIDFGFVGALSIGSTVFEDNNGDAIQNGVVGESTEDVGLDGVRLRLYTDDGDGGFDSGDELIDSTLTVGGGNYIFDELPEGTYFVVAVPPSTHLLSSREDVTQNTDDDVDSDDNGIQSMKGEVSVSPLIELVYDDEALDGDEETGQGRELDDGNDANGNMTVDFGFVPELSLGSTLFVDADRDGFQGVGDGIIPDAGNYTFILTSPQRPSFSEVIDVDASGNYFIEGLEPGQYVMTGLIPDGYELTTQVDEDNNQDGDNNGLIRDGSNWVTPVILLQGGSEPVGFEEPNSGGIQDDEDDDNGDMTIDIGFVVIEEPAMTLGVGNFVFYDANNNGVYDPAVDDREEPLEGVVLNLYRAADNTLVGKDTSDMEGLYLFDGLSEGDYYILAEPLADYPHSSGELLMTDPDQNGTTAARTYDISTQLDDEDGGTQSANTVPHYGLARSVTFTLSEGGQPSNESGVGSVMDDGILDSEIDLTIDFGFTRADYDNDAIFDHEEDSNNDGVWNEGVESNFEDADTDGDRLWDGLEVGKTDPTDQTSIDVRGGMEEESLCNDFGCKLDADPSITTSPIDTNTDGDCLTDAEEDKNENGAVDREIGETDPTDSTDPTCSTSNPVSASAFLEGGLITDITREGVEYGDEMSTILNEEGLLPGQTPRRLFSSPTPAGQPYDIEPWMLDGSMGMEVEYGADVVDWLVVVTRMGMEQTSNICVGIGLLTKSGEIEFPEGYECELVDGQEYHIALMHRNHLPVISPLLRAEGGEISYDFRANDSYKSGLFNKTQKQLTEGRYVMYSGNAFQLDGGMSAVDAEDLGMWGSEFGLSDTYMCSDVDLDGVSSPDDRYIMNLNNGVSGSVRN